MPWLILLTAGVFEVIWALAMKSSQGFTRLWPTLLTAGAMLISVWLLGLSLRHLPVGTAYAVWTGVGAVGASLLGMVIFGESAAAPRLICIGLIVAGIVGLKLCGE